MKNRVLLNDFLPLELCSELIFIHRSLGVAGYRPNVSSTTLFDVLLAEPRLLPALTRARQLVWDAAEEQFGRPCELFVEHTSIMGWSDGASIGWHFDSNRPYLAQRHYSAVAYLNTAAQDFTGGMFCFQSGEPPLQVQPRAGQLLLYSADELNIHCVQPVTGGERNTLTLWFTLAAAHQEDAKVLARLSARGSGLPPSMYLLQEQQDKQQQGVERDLRVIRLRQLGVALHPDTPGQSCQQQQAAPPNGGVQAVVMAAHMLQWQLCPHRPPTSSSSSSSSQGDAGSGDHASGRVQATTGCSCFADSRLLWRAQQLVSDYLDGGGRELESLLPRWQAAAALVWVTAR